MPCLLPLRRQGEAGRGCPRLEPIRKAPLPNPPLPSQGREPKERSMKYLPLIWSELFRRKTRTILTLLSILPTFLLFGLPNGLRTRFARAGTWEERRVGKDVVPKCKYRGW